MDRTLLLTTYQNAKAAFYLEDDVLLDAFLEDDQTRSHIGEIYVGKIKSLAEGIGAAFVEYEKGTVGFLPLSQIDLRQILNRTDPQKITAEQELLVQVYKDPMKHKDATLTTDLLFSGKYLILTPFSPGIRFSRKLKKDQKKTILEMMDQVLEELFGAKEVFTSRYGCIVRTNAIYCGYYDLFYEMHDLFHNACEIITKARTRTAFSLLYQDAPFYRRILRDQYDLSTLRVITDDPAIQGQLAPKDDYSIDAEFESAMSSLTEQQKAQLLGLMDKMQQKYEQKKSTGTLTELSVELWQDDTVPLKLKYKIGSAMEQALQKKVWLKSGAFLVIEPTEALTVIDVNSGKAQSRKFVPENFHLKINLEAAEEIARQLRLRNLSGMILVDFINMDQEESKQALMHEMKRQLLKDPNGANLVDITALGLVEITRKKNMPPLSEVAKKIRQAGDLSQKEQSADEDDVDDNV